MSRSVAPWSLLFVAFVLVAGCRKKHDDTTPIQLSLGAVHSCAAMKDLSIQCWGGEDGPAPARVPGRWMFRQVASGATHTCARVGDDEHPPLYVLCWGGNMAGQTGEPPSAREREPHKVDVDALEVAAGGDSTCARLRDGTVACWGKIAASHVPAPVKGLTKVAQLAVGADHACARLEDGTARCWGKNDRGQLGDGSTIDRDAPAKVTDLANVTRIAAGSAHTCARIGEEVVRCWGANAAGQLGDGTTTDRAVPVTTGHVTGAVQLSLGGDTSCARMQDASLMCWGDNTDKKLADGTTKNSSEARVVFAVFDLVEVAVGGTHACVRFKDNRVRCWGANGKGQVGDGSTTGRAVPVGVKFKAG